jgi:SAM-dependent methyltransferase
MIDRVDAARLPNVHARQMDGQNLVFPDASFDAAVSTFGIMLFPDWQLGLREMARVLRPGGRAAMTTWADPDGAAVNLLLVDVRRSLFPDLEAVPPPGGMRVLADAERLRSALELAGFRDVLVKQVSHAFLLPLYVLDNADLSFRVLPHWTSLTVQQQHQTVAEFRRRATGATSISIPSTANVAVMSRA